MINNPFHKAAVKAFVEILEPALSLALGEPAGKITMRELTSDFERKLEDQAKAFDSCKVGLDVSMTALQEAEQHALVAFHKRLKLDGNFLAAQRTFIEIMKPHFERRLW